ncbi:MAG TPA: pectin acetylesterase-family hydrolase [Polyangiaceae bacterium]|jgi:hypothetical protein
MKSLIFLGLGLAVTVAACGSSSSNPGTAPGSSDAGPADAGGFVPGAPITGLAQNKWTWVPIEGAKCRDGSSTGIGVNLGTSTDKVMIFLEGGGACFNATTCALMNPSKYGASDFNGTFTAAEGNLGVFDRTDAMNPVSDWSYVYVPYCTGDIHAGNNVTGGDAGAGVANQHFVGYVNVGLDLQRIVPTFPTASQVLLTGISAGGFGASANYAQVAKAFSSLPVALLDDSGPPMEDPYETTCQQKDVTALWGLDKTLLSDCGSDCSNPASYYLDYAKHIGKQYPNAPFGLVESSQDMVITLFFGFGTDNGANDCNGSLGTAESGPMFTMGLQDVRTKLASNPKFGSFFFDGTDHTSLLSALDTRTADGVVLAAWIKQLISGTATNVGLTGTATDGGTDAGTPAADGGTDAGAATDAATPADAAVDGGVALTL